MKIRKQLPILYAGLLGVLPTMLWAQTPGGLRLENEFFNKSVKVRKIAGNVDEAFGLARLNPETFVFVGKTRPGFFTNADSKRADSFFRLFQYDQVTEKVSRLAVDGLCEITTNKYNIGGFTSDPDEKFLVVAVNDASDRVLTSKMALLHVDLSMGFAQCATLPFVNSDYNYHHPFYDIPSQRLYFISDIPGGVGGYDVYFSKRLGPNTWSEPINVRYINTPNDELFPTTDAQGNLYFSKLTLNQGYDIFMVPPGKQRPIRLLHPYNSISDDYGFIQLEEKKAALSRSDKNRKSSIYLLEAF